MTQPRFPTRPHATRTLPARRSPVLMDAEPVIPTYRPLPSPPSRLAQGLRLMLAGALGGALALFLAGGPGATVAVPGAADFKALLTALLDSRQDEARRRQALEQELQALHETRLREIEQRNQQLQAQLQALETAQRRAEDTARIRALTQEAAQRLAGDLGGGRNVTGAPLADSAWSCNAGQCAILMRASWNGAWIASHYYWVEGILYIDPQGQHRFQENARSRNLGGTD